MPWRNTITGLLKSQEDFYVRLHTQLISCDPLELSSLGRNSLARDLATLRSRVSNEGLAFLTKTLPLLGKALDRGLVSGRLNVPRGFTTVKSTSRPAFMQAYFSLVFSEDGSLLDGASVGAIKHLRQVLFFAYKLDLPFSAHENSRVIEEFVRVDEEVGLQCDPLASSILELAKIITGKVFHGFDHRHIQPRHGPGAVATGEKHEQKWKFHRLYNAIHQVYPYYNYYVVGGAHELADRLEWYRQLRRHESGCAKVVLVPKDSRGPRLISCEPLEYQWIQQGLGRKLQDHLEWDSFHTRGHVNFTRQEINGDLALVSSADQRFATIDLKDASDRVSLELVRRVFERSPDLLRALEACRTTETLLPDGRVVPLNKYAPMGSALCFPVESYCFWVVLVSAVIRGKNLPLHEVEKCVYVYGDDIVVPTEWASLCVQALESVGLQVNLDKSCTTGFFRESCGVDAFKGTNVTPLRLRKRWTDRKTDGAVLLSYTSLANKMADSYRPVSDLIWAELEKLFGNLPYGTSHASYPCKVVSSALLAETLNGKMFRSRYNRNFQRIEFKVLRLHSRRRATELDGWPRLLRDVVTPPFGDPSTMVLPLSMRIKSGWTRTS